MSKIKNKKTLIVGLLIAIAIIANGCKKNVEGLVAKVNKEEITLEEYNAELEVQRTIYVKQFGEEILTQPGPNGLTLDETLRQEVLDGIIVEKLISQDAKGKDISVDGKEIEEALEEMKASIGGEEAYKSFLESNEISEEYYEEYAKKGILMEKYYLDFLENTEIKEEDIEEFFEENKESLVVLRARHILMSDEEEAKKILERINAGEDFEEIALTESLDSSSAVQGGDLGYFTRGTLIKEFEDAAFALDVGEISGLVKTEVGYHIIKLEDKKESLKDLQEQIVMVLKEAKFEENIVGLRNKADIEVFLDVDEIGDPADNHSREKDEAEESDGEKEDKK